MVVHGDVLIDSINLKTRDALGVYDTSEFKAQIQEDAELLLIEVPMEF